MRMSREKIIVKNQSDSSILFGAPDPTYQLILRECITCSYQVFIHAVMCCLKKIFRILNCTVHTANTDGRPCEVIT